MLQSKIFTKTSKEAPKEETSANAKLLEQAGFVQKTMAGVYSYLPLGMRVLKKIENIVRQEMDAIGAEVLMPSLQPKENWVQTDRWQTVDVLFKLKSQQDIEYALGPTHEEIVTPAAKRVIFSYRDLPSAVYQIQTKFRDELRAKSGLLRGREFRMKDLYSFHSTQEDLDAYYAHAQQVYFNVFKRLGLNAILAEASGGTFSKYSHEFQVEVAAGEDDIYVCEKCGLAKNKEVYSGAEEHCTNCGKTTWRETRGCEVGNIFKLGTKFSDAFDFKFLDNSGAAQPVIMGCYGIGTTRLMGVIAELCNDAGGLIWPESAAPYMVHIVQLMSKDPEKRAMILALANKAADSLTAAGIDVLVDDREESAGAKFADSDLIGIPYRWVISEKNVESFDSAPEIKRRDGKDISRDDGSESEWIYKLIVEAAKHARS